jgi:hypothetical protein
MIMERSCYINQRQDEAYTLYQDGVAFQKSVESVYDEIDFKIKLPDFLGKTVKVTQKQFPEVYRIVSELSADMNIESPTVYVYEDYYYGAESYGISHYWIELSAKTIQDFSEAELRFLIAREIYKIADGVTKQKTMMEERFKVIRQTAPNEIEEMSKLSFYHWYRFTNFSADNFGYLMCGSMKTAVQTILKLVLNSVMLSEQVDIKEFIGQASEINRLDDTVYNYTKADESAPYAPHRIQSLLAYAVSDRGMRAGKELKL